MGPTTFAVDPAQNALEKFQGDTLQKLSNKDDNRLLKENLNFVSEDLETKVFPKTLKFIFQISSFLIMIIFVYAGIRLVLSQGEEEELKTAKNMLLYSVIGAVIIMASFALVTGLVGYLSSLNQ
jgi:hypothetical protein